MLQEMFGEDSVPKIFKGEKLYVTVDGKKANIDLLNLVNSLNIKTNSWLHKADSDSVTYLEHKSVRVLYLICDNVFR